MNGCAHRRRSVTSANLAPAAPMGDNCWRLRFGAIFPFAFETESLSIGLRVPPRPPISRASERAESGQRPTRLSFCRSVDWAPATSAGVTPFFSLAPSYPSLRGARLRDEAIQSHEHGVFRPWIAAPRFARLAMTRTGEHRNHTPSCLRVPIPFPPTCWTRRPPRCYCQCLQ